MWQYEKRLEYPVNIKQTDPKTAQYILSQYGGPDGEINASLRYLSQRYSIPYREVAGLLTDIATEEIAHFEMIATIVHQLTRDLTPEEIKASNFGPYYIDHTLAVWSQAAGGVPQNACEFQSKGDPITDLMEDMAAEQKARATYEHLMTLTDDKSILDPLNFLREREIVHYQRFGECLEIVQGIQSGSKRRVFSASMRSGR